MSLTDFSLRLTQFRTAHDISQVNLAMLSGISRAALSSYESRGALPNTKQLYALVTTLGELADMTPVEVVAALLFDSE